MIFPILFFPQALILKLKDPDPNPGVVISVLATIGELAQVTDHFLAWSFLDLSDDLIFLPTAHYLGNLQEKHQSSSVQERVENASIEIKYLWTLVEEGVAKIRREELCGNFNKIYSYMWLQCLVLKNGLELPEKVLIRVK